MVIAKSESGNAKIGDAATTYVEQRSCPTECVFFDGGGCYAEDGPLGKFVTQPLNRAAAMFVNATPEEIAEAEAAAIDRMEVVRGRPLRLHTVGDCKTDEAARIVAAAAARYRERGGGAVWTYTHAWRTVERASWGAVSVLASCETHADCMQAAGSGYATALVVEHFEQDTTYDLHAGSMLVRLIPCPAETRDIPCSDCRLCFRDDRRLEAGVTIGFAIHGTKFLRRKARLALTDPGNPNRKKTLRELIPAYEAEHGSEVTNREIADALGYEESSVWQMRKSLRTGLPTVKKAHHREKKRRG